MKSIETLEFAKATESVELLLSEKHIFSKYHIGLTLLRANRKIHIFH